MTCPNCGQSAIRFEWFDEPCKTHYHSYRIFVGRAIHKDIVGHDSKRIPEKFCYLDEDEWNHHLGEMQDENTCETCSLSYSRYCSKTLKECLEKQQEWLERTGNA